MNDNLPPLTDPQELLHYLQLFQSYSQVYDHPKYNDLLYTPGVRFACEQAGLYPFFNKIGDFLNRPAFRLLFEFNQQSFLRQRWTMNVLEDKSATVFARSLEDVHPFYTGSLFSTTTPLDQFDFYVDYQGDHWLMSLGGEIY